MEEKYASVGMEGIRLELKRLKTSEPMKIWNMVVKIKKNLWNIIPSYCLSWYLDNKKPIADSARVTRRNTMNVPQIIQMLIEAMKYMKVWDMVQPVYQALLPDLKEYKIVKFGHTFQNCIRRFIVPSDNLK